MLPAGIPMAHLQQHMPPGMPMQQQYMMHHQQFAMGPPPMMPGGMPGGMPSGMPGGMPGGMPPQGPGGPGGPGGPPMRGMPAPNSMVYNPYGYAPHQP